MPKRYTFKEVDKVLMAKGFTQVSQVGSHIKFRKIGTPTLTAIVPKKRKAIPIGTFRSILRQAHMALSDFERQLKQI
ncbi:type II toxin-antitoxin system HicA family toxin [Candidatus Berkelbacteria bacterium]|nr:type II toxin-antitoxin system HicA family toxin [Candidatus Berkelbacteria bacterium]